MTTTSTSNSQLIWRPAAAWTAVVAIVVCLFIATMLVMGVREQNRLQPLNSPELAALKNQLADRPNDASLKDHIRQRDEALRRGYFSHQRFVANGAWLLVGAAAALIVALKSYSTLAKSAPQIAPTRPDPWDENRLARWGVGLSGLLIVGIAGSWAYWQRPSLPVPDTSHPVVMFPASDTELAKNWPSFRGFTGDGIVSGQTLPDAWDATANQGILWKVKVPLPGHSSPILFGDNLLLTGSDGEAQSLYCFSAQTGKLTWEAKVSHSGKKANAVEDTGFAASTPCTDGVRVYTIFASGDLAAFDFAGRKLWARNLGTPDSQYGYAASLAIHQGLLVIQWDNAATPEEGKSFLFGIDGASGKQLWRTARPVSASWSSPTVADGKIFTVSNPYVIAYSVADGKELFRAKLMDGDVAVSPLYHDGTLYVANDRAVAAAMKTGVTGEVQESSLLWTNKDVTLPDMVSPVTDGKYLLLVHGGGEGNCLDAQTGKILWTNDFKASMASSPILAGHRVYLTDKEGTTHVFDLADKFAEIRTCKLGEAVTASPAASNGRLYIRGKDNLYCIGK